MPYRKRFQHRKKQAREKREKKFQQRLESSDTCIPLSETDTILTSESSFTTTDESQSLSGVTDHIGTCVRDSPGDTTSAKDKAKMMLSRETLEGIGMTVMSFVEITKYLLSQPKDSDQKLYVLSERISQDPLENYFGKQRARGGRNENPNLQQCLHNAAGIQLCSRRLSKSQAHKINGPRTCSR